MFLIAMTVFPIWDDLGESTNGPYTRTEVGGQWGPGFIPNRHLDNDGHAYVEKWPMAVVQENGLLKV